MAKKITYREHKPSRRKSNTSPQEEQTTTIPQNSHITRWEISPSTYNEDNNMITFYVDTHPVGHLEITPQTTGEMLTQLTEILPDLQQTSTPAFSYKDIDDIPEEDPLPEYLQKSSVPDSWLITRPEDPTSAPHLYFTEDGKVTTIVTLTPKLIENLVPKLTKIHDPNPQPKTITNWFKKHTKTSILGATIVLGFIIYSITITYFT